MQPTQWKPQVVWDGEEGEITTPVFEAPTPHWQDIMESWGYDPEVYEIVEPVKVTTWDAQTSDGTKQLWSYKAGIRQRSKPREINFDDLIKEVKRHRPLNNKLPDGDDFFVVNIGDTQFGKLDGGGIKATIERILGCIDGVENRIRELRKIGRKLGTLVVVGGGDIVEGCDGNYASQIWNVELNRREQIRVAVRLIRDAIARWAKLFKRVVVTAVPGNHGENRKDGRNFTTIGDNDDVAVFERVAEIFAFNPKAYGHVEFYLPEDEPHVTLQLGNKIVGWTHGHITGGGANPQAKLKSWWEDQTFGHQPIGEAFLLVSFHYHHFSLVEYNENKIHMQAPALDNGSEWWVNLKGQHSTPGMLTFVVNDNGYTDLQII